MGDDANTIENIENNEQNEDNNLNDVQPGAGGGTLEDTAGFEAVIANLQKQNELLIEQNTKLTEQFSTLVRNGAQFNDNGHTQTPSPNGAGFENPPIPDDYVPLRELGREIGKPISKE